MNETKKYDTLDELVRERIRSGREFMKMPSETREDPLLSDYRTDQELKKQQPPLYKAPSGGEITLLPKDFEDLDLTGDIIRVIYERKSSRIYTDDALTLLELSFLLWATQGVKGIRGRNYATLRTVPCGGARHEFECYIAVRKVEGLLPGYYHYMPDRHAVEMIRAIRQDGVSTEEDSVRERIPVKEDAVQKKDHSEEHAAAQEGTLQDLEREINESLCGQRWACRAAAVMYYSCIPYRAEWRYGIDAHRAVLMDSGHITENLYLACSASGLGTCAVAAVETEIADAMFLLDGEEEFIFYAAPVGTISKEDEEKEAEIYAFLKDENGAASPQS